MEPHSDPIVVRLSDWALEELSRCKTRVERGQKLLEFIDREIDKMDKWSMANLGGPGAKFENTWLRTYLYRRLTHELTGEGDIDSLSKQSFEAHPAVG